MVNENVKELTDANFDEQVLQSDVLTLVVFWAEWSGPSKQIAPIVHDVAAAQGFDQLRPSNLHASTELARKCRPAERIRGCSSDAPNCLYIPIYAPVPFIFGSRLATFSPWFPAPAGRCAE